MLEVEDMKSAAPKFDWVEYSVCGTMLFLSLVIGVYYGWFKKQDTVAEYMLGGKKMSVFPIAVSMFASQVSGVTILGVPGEIYTYGTQFCSVYLCMLITYIITNNLYLPVFYPLQLNSIYEYLELRFNKATRTLGSLLFALSLFIYIPVVIYVPSLAFNQVTGLSMHLVAFTICLICIFYTSFGGLKAVVWTDALQGFFTLGSTLFVTLLGFWAFGSVGEVLRINNEGSRLEMFNMDPSPFARSSFWIYSIGSIFHWMSLISIHPGAVQRYIAVSTLDKAKSVTTFSFVGHFLIFTLVMSVGMLEYATYFDCDPIATGRVQKAGQILPMYVVEVAKDNPGVTGLFMSGILSAALSVMSASLHTVAGTVYEDFVMYVRKGEKLSDTQQNFVTKMIILLLGVICALLVMVVEKLGAILQIGIGLQGLTNGALIGLFTLGLFFPRANAKGAIVGGLVSLVLMGTIVFGAQYYTMQGLLKYPGKVTRVDGCPANFTDSLPFNASAKVDTYIGVGSPVLADSSVSLIFQMHFLYYNLAGASIVILVGLIVSYLSDPVDPKSLDPKLYAPFVRNFLPNTEKQHSPPQPPTEVVRLVCRKLDSSTDSE